MVNDDRKQHYHDFSVFPVRAPSFVFLSMENSIAQRAAVAVGIVNLSPLLVSPLLYTDTWLNCRRRGDHKPVSVTWSSLFIDI